MMIEGFDDALFFRDLSMEARIWYHNGGSEHRVIVHRQVWQ